jgi:hypothetical protein
VTRAEFDALRGIVAKNGETADRNRAEHEVEFRRIAEIQLKLDRLAGAVERLLRAG